MVIEKNKVVQLKYVLKEEKSSDILETVTEKQPLTFIYGAGKLLKQFEKKIEGLKQNDKFDFCLKKEEAYGLSNDQLLLDLPKNMFMQNNEPLEILQIGNFIPMEDVKGNKLNGKVLEIKEETVKMDFNHPMAGKDLHFEGEILNIREASEHELNHNHSHSCSSCGGEHSCGSGSDKC